MRRRKEGDNIYYLDVLWVINLIIHVIIFSGTSRLIKKKISLRRLLFISAAASCSVFIVMTPFENWLIHPAGKGLLSVFCVLGAFGFVSLQLFLRTLCMFYVVSFLAAGVMLGMESIRFSAVQSSSLLSEHSASMFSSFSYSLILFAVPFIWKSLHFTERIMKLRNIQMTKLADVIITMDDSTVQSKALVDTGNQVKDPVTGTPLMVAELSLFKHILPDKEYEKIRRLLETMNLEELEYIHAFKGRWRIVPFRTAGHEMKMMLACKPDKVQVHYAEKMYTFDPFLIGLECRVLSSSSDFSIIFPSDPIQEADTEEAS
ncbi:sigma-E processing peptidase SpoIIGA [Alteribacillus sp. HJP-4]|uniref:sigma-E processing peptidase SpoIIGA n=1 Tax=Alteribacillus sp. HJP-4 TaxID=2775394 RepID=UPI0035CD3A18